MSRLALDVNGAFDPAAGGLSRSDLEGAAGPARDAFEAFQVRRRSGKVGFADLPADEVSLAATLALAARLSARYDDLLVLGIGGSSLGG